MQIFHLGPLKLIRRRVLNVLRFLKRWNIREREQKEIEGADKTAWNGSRRRTCWCETPTSRVITPHIVPMSLVGVAVFLRFRWESRCSEKDWLRCLCNTLSSYCLVLLSSSTCRSRFRFSSFSTDTCTCVGDVVKREMLRHSGNRLMSVLLFSVSVTRGNYLHGVESRVWSILDTSKFRHLGFWRFRCFEFAKLLEICIYLTGV